VLNINVVKRGIIIRFVTKLGSGLSVILARHNLSGNKTLSTTIIGVFGTPHMVFTNMIMITHVIKITNRPLMNSMVAGRYKNAYVMSPKGGYQEPSYIIIPILDHKNGHYIRINRVTLKYPYFKIYINPDAHVKMFNSIVKVNVKTSREYIINAFSYTLKDITYDWFHNYMLELL
jgi:hypothetical protein